MFTLLLPDVIVRTDLSASLDEEKIEEQVSALRTKLLAEASALVQNAKALKPSDTHGIAAAKKDEPNKMARALGTRSLRRALCVDILPNAHR